MTDQARGGGHTELLAADPRCWFPWSHQWTKWTESFEQFHGGGGQWTQRRECLRCGRIERDWSMK